MHQILLVDPNSQRRNRIAFLLRHLGYAVDAEVDCVGKAEGAIRRPDLVLVSERVLCSHTQEVVPWLLRAFGAPTVVLGNEPEEVAGIPYLEMGADAYMPLPLNLRELLARVRALLNRHSPDPWNGLLEAVPAQVASESPSWRADAA